MISLLVDAHLSQMVLLKELHPLLRKIHNKSLEEAKTDFAVNFNFPKSKDAVGNGGRYERMLADASKSTMYEVEIIDI